ncbi:hypothetical protein HWV62_39501 [Athelia sp. TMB]|nr:hypothetical protein HWV62_39501 [Athelia sp. TMB]
MASLIGTQTSEKTFKKGKRGKGRVDGSNEKGKGRDEMGIEQRLNAERVALLAEKQAEMEKVVDSHDTLVRESFQLEKFVTMLLYDPAVAKQSMFRWPKPTTRLYGAM